MVEGEELGGPLVRNFPLRRKENGRENRGAIIRGREEKLSSKGGNVLGKKKGSNDGVIEGKKAGRTRVIIL